MGGLADKKGVGVPTKGQRAEALRLYQSTAMSAAEIGARYGVSRQTIQRWVQQAGIERRGQVVSTSPRTERPEPSDPLVQLMLERVDLTAQVSELNSRVAELTGALNGAMGQIAYLAGRLERLLNPDE